MRGAAGKAVMVLWAALLAFLILTIGQGVWAALLVANLRSAPAVPWAVPAMTLALWLMWRYLGGAWWPRKTSEARRKCLRANRVSGQVFAWSAIAGVLAMIALAGCWIVFFQLVPMTPNAIPDLVKYPLFVVMASLVSPIVEEAAFRGYCQVILEREFTGVIAVGGSSVFFALAHLTHGLFWPKLLVYFLVGAAFGATAYLTNSTLPALPVHIFGDLLFFILVWPHDATRRLVSEGGADMWFWLHAAQAIVFGTLAIFAFVRLAKIARRV